MIDTKNIKGRNDYQRKDRKIAELEDVVYCTDEKSEGESLGSQTLRNYDYITRPDATLERIGSFLEDWFRKYVDVNGTIVTSQIF